jgi:hypothetical protein
MHAIPGELLTSTELKEDTDYNASWKVPNSMFDISDHRIMLEYGELWLVIASWHEKKQLQQEANDPWDTPHEFTVSPALLWHLPSKKIFKFDDIERVGWLWRPSTKFDREVKEIRGWRKKST